MKLQRYSGNPILSPIPDSPWESRVVANPGVWLDPESGEIKMLYRASGSDDELKVHFGLATSKDGFHFERASAEPVFSPSADGFDAGCVEDPRIVKMGEWYYVTYASRPFPPGHYWLPPEQRPFNPPQCPPEFPWTLRENATSTGLALTKDFRTWIRAGRITSPALDDRDVILFPERVNGRFVLLHRPMNWVGPRYGTEYPAMWISFSDDLLCWQDSRLLAKAELPWENNKIGGNTPPIRTADGWLEIYHAVGTDGHYRLGAMLLDLDDPSIVRKRTPDWILQPEEPYELVGYYTGCVFPCGAVVLNDTLFIYYGGADKYVGIATCPIEGLLSALRIA